MYQALHFVVFCCGMVPTSFSHIFPANFKRMGLLPDTPNCGLRMRSECRERFPRHRCQRKPLVSDPGMHHGTCVTHVPWCMSGSQTRGGGENVPGIPGGCASRNLAYLVRGPWEQSYGCSVNQLIKREKYGQMQQTNYVRILTHFDLITPQGDMEKRVNIGSSNSSFLGGTKPLPEPMLTSH